MVYGKFICHKDFENTFPLNVFHKEHSPSTETRRHSENLKNKHIIFRKKFYLPEFKKAMIKITADDYYKLYVNGEFVTQGPAPSYRFCYYYNETDISGYLKPGENVIAVHTYYQGLINRVWISGDEMSMMWCELECDGERVASSDESWRCTYHSGYKNSGLVFGYDTGYAEDYDSSSSEEGFENPDYDDSGWDFATVKKNVDYKLEKQPTKQLDIYEVKPKLIKKTDRGIFCDMGFEAVGALDIYARGQAGDTVEILCGEETAEDDRVRYKMRCNCEYREKWTLSGKADRLNQYDYKAFRYFELVYPESVSVDIDKISMIVRHYPFEDAGKFKYKNPLSEKILKLCKDTLKYGTQEVIMDCPTREKGQYLGDLSISGRAHALLTGNSDMFKKAVIDFCNSSFICEGLMSVAPSSLMQEIADYSLQFASQALFLYKFDGDIEFLSYAEPCVTGVLRHFEKFENNEGLLDGVTDKWNLVDWPSNLRDGYSFELTKPVNSGIHNVINAFWYGFLCDIDEIYGILGKEKTGKAALTKKSFIKHFYNPESRLFCDAPDKIHSAVQSNILPLLFGMHEGLEGCKEKIIGMIVRKRLVSMGVYMAYFALQALKNVGESDLAEELICDEGCWLNMISEGASVTFEAWGKDQKWNTSLFHPWATAPVIILSSDL